MRSIRFSLIVYFLVLLAVALGGVSWLVYQTTAQTLREKQISTHDLIQAQYRYQCQEVQNTLDERILRQAQALASMARSGKVHFEPYYVLGVLSTAAQPQGYLNAPLWLSEGMHPRIAQMLFSMRPAVLFIEGGEDLIPPTDEFQAQEYFQTFSRRGTSQQRSESLGKRSFTLDPEIREKAELFVERYDTVELEPGTKVRRVTVKAMAGFRLSAMPHAWRFLLAGPKGYGGKGSPPQQRFGPPPEFGYPTIFVQYASDTSLMDKKLSEFRTEQDTKLAQLETESHATLQNLRLRLLWICLLTFAGIVAGGYFLVRLVLAPLARLSEAVSQVTEKDFRLKIDQDNLPRELQPIADRLTHTLEQLQAAFAREKQAAADISHELRTPLAAMMTTVELALRKSRSLQEYRDLLEDIRASGDQMAHLVERLLALARLDAGADHLRAKKVDAREIAQQCTHLIRPLAEARGLALRLHAPDAVPLETDPDKLREILNNLLHNAIEYNRPQGTIDLDVSRVNGHVRLMVSDTGIGISPKQREHIFERFFRADPSRHADTPHAGLGLSIVKGYLDLMGGKIRVDSDEGGSTFTVELPVSEPVE